MAFEKYAFSCMNCIHFDVCDGDRQRRQKCNGNCSDYWNDANVIPKGEIETLRGQLKATERYLEMMMEVAQKSIENVKTDVAREIFEELEEYMLPALIGNKFPAKVINPDKFAELKKKYTEDKQNGNV